jgi:uncharacterized protein (TIGR03067 family)
MNRYVTIAALLFVGVTLLALTEPSAEGCAAIGRIGEPSITIAQESAIIVWDPAKKIQHFIRRAAFDTKSPDFGFLVPTPTMPQLPLKEVEDGIFRTMDTWLLPRVVDQNRWKLDPLLCMFGCSAKPAMRGGMEHKDAVRVLHEQKVGGFESAVLEADNTESLSDWLKKNGYSNDPELQSWLVPYVANKWKITAFKITQDPKTGGHATTKAVRMSFTTDQPFFPYREPEAKLDVKPKEKPAPTEIDGIWRVESAEGDFNELNGTTIWFGEGITVSRLGKDVPFTVDASKEPKWLDVLKDQGIYKLDGDTLTWRRGKKTRPASFDAKEGTLLVLKRGTKAEADQAIAGVAARERERLNSGNRLLRVLFVSGTRMAGKLGQAPWHANVTWSDTLTDEQRQRLVDETGVPESEIPATARLTTFEDRASPRPGRDEVWFEPSADQAVVRPPDFVRFHDVWIPFDVVLFGVLTVVVVVTIGVAIRKKKI